MEIHACRELPDSVFVAEARKYTSRIDWKKGSSWSYQHVLKKRKYIITECTDHMGSPNGLARGYQVYAYEFLDKLVYIGLTCNPKRRHKDHALRGSVGRKISDGFIPIFKIIKDNITSYEASKLEIDIILRYKEGGWVLLNKHRGGSLGQIRAKYAYDLILSYCREHALKQKNELEHGNNGMYQAVQLRKWMPRLAADMGWKEHAGDVWTYDSCLESAKKHKYITDYSRATPSAYQAAWKHGWFKKIKREVFKEYKKPPVMWNQEACRERAKAFSCRSDWQVKAGDGSYIAARRSGWLNDIANSVYGKRKNRWDNRT